MKQRRPIIWKSSAFPIPPILDILAQPGRPLILVVRSRYEIEEWTDRGYTEVGNPGWDLAPRVVCTMQKFAKTTFKTFDFLSPVIVVADAVMLMDPRTKMHRCFRYAVRNGATGHAILSPGSLTARLENFYWLLRAFNLNLAVFGSYHKFEAANLVTAHDQAWRPNWIQGYRVGASNRVIEAMRPYCARVASERWPHNFIPGPAKELTNGGV